MPIRPSSNHLLTAAIVLALLIVAATALAAPLDADKLAEPPLAGTGIEHEYLRLVHERVHPRWTDNFLRLASGTLPASDPVNDPARATTVDMVLAADGQIVAIDVAKGSGFAGFDDAAREVLRDSVPFPSAAIDVRSDDGQIHLRWIFARDQRRCADVTVLHIESLDCLAARPEPERTIGEHAIDIENQQADPARAFAHRRGGAACARNSAAIGGRHLRSPLRATGRGC